MFDTGLTKINNGMNVHIIAIVLQTQYCIYSSLVDLMKVWVHAAYSHYASIACPFEPFLLPIASF